MATVLLTGAVRPSSPVALDEPRERLFDYLCAIHCWLGEPTVESVVYFDGSGVLLPPDLFDSDRLSTAAADFGAIAARHGKGRAEALILTSAASSGALGEAFYKATGRLYVENFAAIDAALDRTRDFASVPRTFTVPTRIPRVRRTLRTILTMFFWTRTSFLLERLAPLTERIDDSSETTYIESVYASAARSGGAVRMEPRPLLVGRSATSGSAYRHDYPESVRVACRPLLERVPLDS